MSHDFAIQPYKEFVFSVGNLAKALDFYAGYLGWETVVQGPVAPSVLAAWQLPPAATAQEVLLRLPGTDTGQLRLVQFRGLAQRHIRSGGKAWDPGGFMDIDLRVADLGQVYDDLREMGWHGVSDPVEMRVGPFHLHELLIKGHDEVMIAFVQRLVPPQPHMPGGRHVVSNIYLSAMIVRDLAPARHFFVNQLGFVVVNELPLRLEGDNMFGLPHNVIAQTAIELVILSPDGARDTMLDLIYLPGIVGQDHSAHAVPPNRGVLMCRFPVRNLAAYHDFVRANGVRPVTKLHRQVLAPYGEVELFAVRSPDGAWLEFFEVVQ
jgi:catechol 2,3-dioxygenase-like lactoylglutathione lyase family enzyme